MKKIVLFYLLGLITLSLFAQQFELPLPSGPYKIGTRYLYFTDINRPDIFTPNNNDFRELSVQVWYPATPSKNQTPVNYSNVTGLQYVVDIGFFKETIIEDVALKPAHSYLDARVSDKEGKYPVVFYSASGVMDANIILFEELASNGYMVFAVGHPHWCEYYYKKNGEIYFRDQENDDYNKQMWAEENSDTVLKIKNRLTRARSLESKLHLQRELNKAVPTETNDVKLWADDISFLIDELYKLNDSDKLFKGFIDMDNIGIIGYSKGGAAAGQTCITEKRCKAGVNLSGFMLGDIAEKNLTVPFMAMDFIEPWCKDCLPINDLLFHTSESSIFMVQIKGGAHGNFTDVSAFKDYVTDDFKNVLGDIDGFRFLEIQNAYVLQFFDKYLKGLSSKLLDESLNKYPEVTFKSRINDHN